MATETLTLKTDPKYDDYDFPTTAPRKQNGHPGHTTPEQDAQVAQLRLKLESLGYSERLDTLTLVCTGPQRPVSNSADLLLATVSPSSKV